MNPLKEDNFCPHCNPCRHAERLDELDALRGVMVGLASRYGNGPGGGEFTTLEDMTERITEGVDTIIEVEKKRSLSETTHAERRLRRFAEIISLVEGETDGFGDSTAADHELSAIRDIFLERRAAGDDAYTAFCAALDTGMPLPEAPEKGTK